VPSSTSYDGEEQPLQATLFIKVSGQIDPNQPDVLTGSEVSGTLEAGQTVK